MPKRWFGRQQALPPVFVSLDDITPKIKSDKEFWSECACSMLDYELRDSKTAIRIADELLDARRERFPDL